jgi:hypothetical protein
MKKSLLTTFASLDQHQKEVLADIESPLLLALAALKIAQEKCSIERLPAEHITASLECAGIAVSKHSITNALTKARGRVSVTRNETGETLYKLMTKGQREINAVTGSKSMEVLYIKSNQPRTARLKLSEILSSLQGEVMICDPYYGVRTLDSLDYVPRTCRIKFITAKTNETGRKLQGAISDFKKERSNVEFRIAASPNELHDRYVVTREALFILGHGLKDIGGKESFIIRLDKKLIPDLIQNLISSFNEKWKTGNPI